MLESVSSRLAGSSRLLCVCVLLVFVFVCALVFTGGGL